MPDSCVYRETVTINKPLTLRGGPDVHVWGPDVWTAWARSGRYWIKGTVPRFEALNKIPDPQRPTRATAPLVASDWSRFSSTEGPDTGRFQARVGAVRCG